MARDLAENALARALVLELLEHCKTLPVTGRADAGNSWLHVRLLREMCDFKDRVTKQVESVMQKAMRELKESETLPPTAPDSTDKDQIGYQICKACALLKESVATQPATTK